MCLSLIEKADIAMGGEGDILGDGQRNFPHLVYLYTKRLCANKEISLADKKLRTRNSVVDENAT